MRLTLHVVQDGIPIGKLNVWRDSFTRKIEWRFEPRILPEPDKSWQAASSLKWWAGVMDFGDLAFEAVLLRLMAICSVANMPKDPNEPEIMMAGVE